MNESLSKILAPLGTFFRSKRNRRLLYIAAISLVALGDFMHSGFARRTFVFYTIRNSNVVVEDRFLFRSGDRETDIRRYVEQAVLGPKAQELLVLPFSREVRVQSVMYRDGVVFVSLSELAALPAPGVESVFHSFLTLNKGIRRNFYFVKDVRMFIGGNHVFFEEFSEFFGNSADNSKT